MLYFEISIILFYIIMRSIFYILHLLCVQTIICEVEKASTLYGKKKDSI